MEFEISRIKREIEIEGFNSIYYFEFGKDFTHPPERHDFWEMTYIDSGEIDAITEGHGRTISQGQILFNKPNELHAHISNKKVPNNMLVVSFTTRSPAMEFFDRKVFTLGKTSKTLLSLFIDEAKRALGDIPHDYNDKNALDFRNAPFGSLQLLECYLTEFLIVLKRSNEESISPVIRTKDTRELGQSSIAELIVSYLGENVYSSLTLADISAKFFMGKTQLCKIFEEYLNESPMECYTRLKMTEAKRQLREEKISISKLSDMLGYSSIHNFSRAFKKYAGVSPTEYKKRIIHTENE